MQALAARQGPSGGAYLRSFHTFFSFTRGRANNGLLVKRIYDHMFIYRAFISEIGEAKRRDFTDFNVVNSRRQALSCTFSTPAICSPFGFASNGFCAQTLLALL